MLIVAITDSASPERVGTEVLRRARDAINLSANHVSLSVLPAREMKPPKSAHLLRAAIGVPATALWIVGRRLAATWGMRELPYYEPLDQSQPQIVVIPSVDARSLYWGRAESLVEWRRYVRGLAP